MDSRFTRRRFLATVGAGATYFALANTVGCESSEHTPKVAPLPGVPLPPLGGVWDLRSRPELSPPAIEVTTEAHDNTAPGYIFLAPEKGEPGRAAQ
jgi:hypothetical protein